MKNLDNGYYYLTDDIQLGATWAFSKARNIVLCLNGHDITFTGTSGSFLSGSNVTFTLTDCQSDAGKITGNTAATMAGGVYVKGTFEVAGNPVVSGNDNSNTATSYPSSMYKYTKNIYLSTGSIAIGTGGLSQGALLDVTPGFPVSSSATPDAVFTLATGSTSDYSAYFTCNSSHEYTKQYDADKDEVQLKYVVPAPPTVTVTFDMQGHGAQVPVQTIDKGTCATKPANPTADGYRFLGWEDDYTDDVARALTPNSFVREGYTFLGWAASAEGDVVCTDRQNITVYRYHGTQAEKLDKNEDDKEMSELSLKVISFNIYTSYPKQQIPLMIR